MTLIFTILICFFAGMGAGLGTGFAGMSAAAVISPMLITFLGMPAYEAVGIALASDVLALSLIHIFYHCGRRIRSIFAFTCFGVQQGILGVIVVAVAYCRGKGGSCLLYTSNKSRHFTFYFGVAAFSISRSNSNNQK